MNVIKCNTNELNVIKEKLKVGDTVLLSGIVYTARDAAHKLIEEYINEKRDLPFDLNGAVIYYAGPTQTRPGKIIGSCGPTTSSRMDKFTPLLLSKNIAAIIGKGERSEVVKKAFNDSKAIYFCAIGGAGALAAQAIVSVEEIAFHHLGCESIKRIVLKEFPVYVAYDIYGGDIFSLS